jgi:uncharacterized iron-regulated protein
MLCFIAHAARAEFPALPAPEAPLDRAHPLVGQIVTASGRLSPQQFADRAKAHDFVLLGERHDNPDHHRLQAWVIEALVASGRRPALAMEMLDADQQAALSDYRKQPGADAAGLGTAVGWDARGWPSWPIYAPIAAAVLRADLPVLPADLTRQAIRAIGRGGVDALRPGLANELESSPRYDAAQSQSLAEELRSSHCGQLPEASLPRMLEVQWARDANMARVLRNAEREAVLIAGTGHVRNDRAVPWHLRETVPERKVLSVALVEVQPGQTDPAAYGQMGLFDVLWFTARMEDDDPCVKFRDSLQRMRRP